GGARGLVPAFRPRRCRGLLLSESFQRQKAIRQHHQTGVVMNPTPRPALEMIQAQFFLHLLVALLHRPPALPEPNRLDPAGPRRQGREGILGLTVGPFLDQGPDRLRTRTTPPGPVLSPPDPAPHELCPPPPP